MLRKQGSRKENTDSVMGYVTKTEDTTTSVRFTGVPAQGKMNTLFLFHRKFLLLNLIEHAVDHD